MQVPQQVHRKQLSALYHNLSSLIASPVQNVLYPSLNFLYETVLRAEKGSDTHLSDHYIRLKCCQYIVSGRGVKTDGRSII